MQLADGCGPTKKALRIASQGLDAGAGKESRTLDLNLGKVALYQLSYSRITSLTPLSDAFSTACILEREKSLELSTSTLARLRSTN
jgi:hypothetical protein